MRIIGNESRGEMKQVMKDLADHLRTWAFIFRETGSH